MTQASVQQRVLDYLQRRGTNAPWVDVQLTVGAAFARLEALIDAIDEATIRQQPSAGGWSIYQVVDHLVESHQPAVEQLRRAMAGEDPGEAIPASLLSTRPYVRQWRALVDVLKQVHRDLLSVLVAGDDARQDLEIPVDLVVKEVLPEGDKGGGTTIHRWLGRLDTKAFAIVLKAHSLEHVQQIERILAAVA